MFLDKLFLMIVVSLFVQAPQKAPNILDNEVFLLGDYEYFWLGASLWSCAISAHINIYIKFSFFFLTLSMRLYYLLISSLKPKPQKTHKMLMSE